MSAICLHFPPIQYGALLAGLFAVTLTSGCATSSVEAPPVRPEPEVQVPTVPRDWIPVARYGRYTLIELAPKAAQQNLLLQEIDVSIPTALNPTVGDALHHVLRRSGYSLCEDDPVVTTLHGLPLPAAHRQLGPLFLRDALLTLAGPAWDLRIDDVARQLCFVHTDVTNVRPPSSDSPMLERSRALPASNGDQP
jgi:type IV pili sensor histidine kinase/response regulator